ncbi:MAG: DUF4097 family beta strand repeat protein [Anaerolineae bacterium]|nr:DUF4097 family beta strand repeat protein [Anaerolineae bacterium]
MSNPQDRPLFPSESESRPTGEDTPASRLTSETSPAGPPSDLPSSAPLPRPDSDLPAGRPPRLGDQPPPLGLPSTPLPSTPVTPPPPRRSSCLLYGVLLLLACGLLSGALAIGGVLLGVQRFERGVDLPLDSAVREVQTAQFEVGQTPRLEIHNDNGRTEVRVGDVRAIQVEATKRATGPNAQARLNEIQLEMNRVSEDSVQLGYRRTRPFSVFNLGGASVDFVVTVPSGTTVDIETSNGETVVDGVRSTVTIKADNGPVTVRNIDGAVSITASNGRVTATTTRGRLTVQTDNGAVEMQEVQVDNLRVRTSNGPVTFNGSLGEGTHEIRTSNGPVTVRVSPDQRLKLDVQTDNGGINNRLQLTQMQSARNRLSGTLNGGGSTLTVRTNNGGVTLETR